MTEDETAQFLSEIHDDIWESRRLRGGSIGRASFESGKLSSEQWSEIRGAIEEHGFACVMGCGVFGFGYSITIYRPGTYPGLPPTHLITVTSKHIESDGPDSDMVWGMFEPLVYSDENKGKLQYLGLPAPKDRYHYDY